MVLVYGDQEMEVEWICLEKNKETNNISNLYLDMFSFLPG